MSNEQWDSYFRQIDGKPASIRVDLGLQQIAPIREKSDLIQVDLMFLKPRVDGLSSDEESRTLWDIEDRLVPFVKACWNAVHAGCITTAGRREFYFYVSEAGVLDEIAVELNKAYPAYSLRIVERSDPAWIVFREMLAPTEREMQTISDRWVLERLAQNGADPTRPHVLDHTVWFSTSEQRKHFRSQLSSVYAVEEEGRDFDRGDKPYWIHVVRIQTLEPQGVHQSVLELYDLAKVFDGYYDGWGTVAEPGNQSKSDTQ